MEQGKEKYRLIRQAARELAMTRQETDAWIEETIAEVEKAMAENAMAENA